MKLSVVIPVYRTAATLNRCVESVLSQEVDDMEVILVDDGSPDSSPQLCDAWAAKDQRIRVIHQQNGGLSKARNSGIEVATGDLIT
ncbi:MAG: glycosyltransferase, partial [Prevotella sp.]|nr:glycosyltransferase [Prevotella sp.]